MYIYEKKLQFPIHIKNPNPALAKYIISAYGGGDGELGASIRYLSQRFTMPCAKTRAILNDIGNEELSHLEMVGTIVFQLLEGSDNELIEKTGYGPNYINHGIGVYPCDSNGVPFNAAALQSTGNPIIDLNENLAAEEKARGQYEHMLALTSDPDVIKPLAFLREREIVHYQRFGEALRIVQESKDSKKYY